MDCPHGEQSQLNSTEVILDDEFRRILWSIKQYIPFINSNYQLSLYRAWLEKLSLSNSEKVERNVYLFELARQIKNNTILPPFNQPPPQGNLKDLPKINLFQQSNTQVHTENLRWPDSEASYQPAPTYVDHNYSCPPQPYQQHPEFEQNYCCPSLSPQSHPLPPYPCYHNPFNNFYYNTSYEEEDDDIDERFKSPQRTRKRRSNSSYVPEMYIQNVPVDNKDPEEFGESSICPEQTPEESPSRDVPLNESQPREVEQEVKEDSSWCDLTDTSATSIAINSLASGDCEKKDAMVQQTVKRFNEFRRVAESTTLQTAKSDTNTTSESDSVKKVQDLSEVKMSLKDTNFISEDWKKTIESLQLRLTETLHQNNDLKSIINSMQIKMQEEMAKCKDQNYKKLTEQHQKEIEALKQVQLENIKQLEKSFQVKLEEAERTYHQKLDKIKLTYEGKVKELRSERDHSKKEKDKEITRLTEIVQHQCTRMSNEIAALRHQIENSISGTSDEKIVVLQKCVSKMDKLFQKTEKEYQKQVDKLKQELELKDKVMQIQLKTQRAELIARTSTEKQRHFDDIVNNLEVKYIKMLEYHEAQVMETRRQDEDKIEHLTNLLEKNDIPYD